MGAGLVVAGQNFRNGDISSYRTPIVVIPKRGERSRSELQFRLKNDSIWSSKTGVMAERKTRQNWADLGARRKQKEGMGWWRRTKAGWVLR